MKPVEEIFSEFLKAKSLRKTPERLAVLTEVYALSSHFSVDSLLEDMKKKGFGISRATIYNTIELLLDCSLLKRHQFGKNVAQFEKSYEFKQHDHMICLDCDKVFEFCDPRIQHIQSTTGSMLNFNITHHSLNFYGNCALLEKEKTCEHLVQKAL